MKIIIAPDSFKESLSADQAATAIRAGFSEIFPNADYVLLPIADGGEGTVDALLKGMGGERHRVRTSDPLGRPIDAEYGATQDGIALLEVAAASGLERLTAAERAPLSASSRGTGELMLAALDAGLRRFVIGLGGSATNDAGLGIIQALGCRVLDRQGQEIDSAIGLQAAARLDRSKLDPRLAECRIELACDVDNPMCGTQGASAIFGPQKGATPAMVEALDAALHRFADLLNRELALPAPVQQIPGGGAAGGIGATLAALLGARLRPGAEIVADITGLERLVQDADLVITGEGRVDSQTARGKAPAGVAKLARRARVPVIALGGSLGADAEALQQAGIQAVFAAVRAPCSLDEALRQAERNLRLSARNVAAALQIGRSLR